MVGFWSLFYSYCGGKNGPECRWEQWLWDLKGTLFTTNFSESMYSFLVFSSRIWLLLVLMLIMQVHLFHDAS
jgi:hypothetical protein